jgi:hypothetical protein
VIQRLEKKPRKEQPTSKIPGNVTNYRPMPLRGYLKK